MPESGTFHAVNPHDWPRFACTRDLTGAGLYARDRLQTLRLSVATMGVGLPMGFSTLLTALIFSLFPLHNPVTDPWLIAADVHLG